MKNLLWIVFAFFLMSCNENSADPIIPEYPGYKKFISIAELKSTIHKLASIEDETVRLKNTDALFDSLRANKQIPFTLGDSVLFLYRGNAGSVKWAGDFNGWNSSNVEYEGTKIGKSNIWILQKQFPTDARLDYKIVHDGIWSMDTENSYIQYSGFGPNSELRMPTWKPDPLTNIPNASARGILSENIQIVSSAVNLNYQVQYKVYTPFGYSSLSNLPVIYITDGHEYSDERLGAMINVVDNLIFTGKINPILIVFIDPRDPLNIGNNRRMQEYRANIKYANFVADELVPKIDANYKTNALPNNRAIMGTSLGGWNAAYFGAMRSDKFQLIGIHSPAFDDAIIQTYKNSGLLPLKVFMSTGVINDTQFQARAMKDIMTQKGYPLLYKEVNEGHSWGNWRALMDEPLIYFFGK